MQFNKEFQRECEIDREVNQTYLNLFMQVKLKSIHEIIPKYDHFVFDMDGVFVLYSPNLVDRKLDY